jgi:hypothetical protein
MVCSFLEHEYLTISGSVFSRYPLRALIPCNLKKTDLLVKIGLVLSILSWILDKPPKIPVV